MSTGGTGYVGMFAVRQDLQGQGIGRELLETAFDVLRGQHCRVCELCVLKVRTEYVLTWRAMYRLVATFLPRGLLRLFLVLGLTMHPRCKAIRLPRSQRPFLSPAHTE